MPRDFDSGDVTHLGSALVFTEQVDCPQCGLVTDGEFHDDSITVEDIVDPPVGEHTCPGCGHGWVSEMTGWIFYGEAG